MIKEKILIKMELIWIKFKATIKHGLSVATNEVSVANRLKDTTTITTDNAAL